MIAFYSLVGSLIKSAKLNGTTMLEMNVLIEMYMEFGEKKLTMTLNDVKISRWFEWLFIALE